MTLQEADKIRKDYGVFLGYQFGKLALIFGGSIPESLLPIPKEKLLEAFKLLSFTYSENKELVDLLDSAKTTLNTFIEDEEALDMLTKIYSNPELKKAIVEELKEQIK